LTAKFQYLISAGNERLGDFYRDGQYAFIAGSHHGWDQVGTEDMNVVLDSDQIGVPYHPRVSLKAPEVFEVPLAAVNEQEEFTVYPSVLTFVHNSMLAESSAVAYFRDPAGTEGSTMEYQGLEMVPLQGSTRPPRPAPAAPCAGAPDPEAGVIEFSAAEFRAMEWPALPGMVKVTRSGGSRGRVTAWLTTSDGSATAGADYEAVNTLVVFTDGISHPQYLSVPMLADEAPEAEETVHLALSDAGGCAALGARSSAILVVEDDDTP